MEEEDQERFSRKLRKLRKFFSEWAGAGYVARSFCLLKASMAVVKTKAGIQKIARSNRLAQSSILLEFKFA